MDSTYRRDQIIRFMRRGGTLAVADLARQVGASRRTVLRDLIALRARGFTISGEGGRGGGVRLDPRSIFVTAQLTVDEVIALVLSVAALRAAPWMPFAAPADAALAKVEGALPDERVRELRAALRRILVGAPADPRAAMEIGRVDPSVLGCFERAFSRRLMLQVIYQDRLGRRSRRAIEPQALLVRAPLWYVIAWDRTKDAARLFRMDRIRRVRVLDDEVFVPRPLTAIGGVCPDARPIHRQR
jgi:predicted DNA-binding transcriptional regulator YafY